jgi:hypothetical protein
VAEPMPITGEIGRCEGTFPCLCGEPMSLSLDDMFGKPFMLLTDGLSSVPRVSCPACRQVYDFAFLAVPRPMVQPSEAS